MNNEIRLVRVKALKSYSNGDFTAAKGEVFFLTEYEAVRYEKGGMVKIHDYPGEIFETMDMTI